MLKCTNDVLVQMFDFEIWFHVVWMHLKLKGHSHHVWKFMNFESFFALPGSRSKEGESGAWWANRGEASGRGFVVAGERDRASCCYWERQSFLLLLRVTEFFRRCWVRRSSCCCCRRGPEFLAESCWVRRRPPTRRGSESSAATGSG